MGGAANPIVGSFLNGIGTNILAGNDPVKGALINASALAGSGNMAGAGQATIPNASNSSLLAEQIARQPSMSYAGNNLINSANAANNSLLSDQLSDQLASQIASQPNMSYAGGNILNSASNVPAPIVEMGTKATSPSYWEQFKLFNRENPGLTQMGFSTAKDLLTPEQIAQAPAVPVQARGQLRDYNPMASMDPYRQSVISNQPISLLG